jgi:very-short-patch-repair endonuclease
MTHASLGTLPALEQIERTVARARGVVRTGWLLRAGWSRRTIDRAIDAGVLFRVCRGWVAVPSADTYLVAAARAGVVVTCITEAKRLGLWTFEGSKPHVGARPHSGHVKADRAIVHWARPLVPRHPDMLVDPIENVLHLAATCQPFEQALVIWESALRNGSVNLQTMRSFDLGPAARSVLEAAMPFADSGLETLVVPRLRWLKLPLRRQIWIAGHHVDLLIGDRLVLQIDGAHHVGAQRERDIAHDAALMLMGYHVIRVGYGQIIDRWHEVQDQIMRAVAAGLHLARS